MKIQYQEITPDRLREQFRKHGYIAVPLSEKRAFLCCELLELNSGLESVESGVERLD